MHPRRILFLTSMPHLVVRGGANRAVRGLAEALVADGNSVCCIGSLRGAGPGALTDRDLSHWSDRNEHQMDGITLLADINGVRYRGVAGSIGDVASFASDAISRESFDLLVVPTEDLSGTLFRATANSGARRVLLAQTPSLLPFGPEAILPDGQRLAEFASADAVCASSNYLSRYIREHSGKEAVTCYLPCYGKGPWPPLGRRDNEFVLMVNPGPEKGSPIVESLARQRPDLRFGLVPGWATTEEVRMRMGRLQNVEWLAQYDDVTEVLTRARVLLLPSMWAENFPLIVTEAMLHGVPVIAADTGGVPECGLGAIRLAAVPHVGEVEPQLDDYLDEWLRALEELLGDESLYVEAAEFARRQATDFVGALGSAAFLRAVG